METIILLAINTIAINTKSVVSTLNKNWKVKSLILIKIINIMYTKCTGNIQIYKIGLKMDVIKI